MKLALLVILIILLGIIIYIYVKRNEKNKQHQTTIDTNTNKYKRYEDFKKSIHIVNQDRSIIGSIYVNGKEEKLSAKKDEKGYIYYLGDRVIGGYNPDIMGDNLIVFRQNTLENQLSDQIKDQITQVIEKSQNRKEQERGLESINSKTKNKKVYEQKMGYEKSIGQEEKEEVEETSKEEQDLKTKNKEKQSKAKPKIQNTVKDINIKQEVDMNTMATDMDTIGKRLEDAGKIKGEEKEGKLGFVESDDLKNLRDENGKKLQGHSSRYEAVSIDKRGNVKALNLENDTQEGTNPLERNYQIKQNKNQNIRKGDVLTRLQIQGEETIGIEKGQYGEVEVYHSHDKTIGGKDIEGNKSLDRQLETTDSKNPIEGTDEATQKLAQKYQDGYRSVEDSYQEAKQHENSREEPCEELEVEDIDGKLNTVSHSHTDDIVAKLMGNEEISNKFTEREIRERVEKAWNNKEEDMSAIEFQKNIEEDIEQDAENMHGERDL